METQENQTSEYVSKENEIKSLYPKIRRYILYKFRRIPHQEIDDLTQEILEKILKQGNATKKILLEKNNTYLNSLIHNHCIDYIRNQQKNIIAYGLEDWVDEKQLTQEEMIILEELLVLLNKARAESKHKDVSMELLLKKLQGEPYIKLREKFNGSIETLRRRIKEIFDIFEAKIQENPNWQVYENLVSLIKKKLFYAN